MQRRNMEIECQIYQIYLCVTIEHIIICLEWVKPSVPHNPPPALIHDESHLFCAPNTVLDFFHVQNVEAAQT